MNKIKYSSHKAIVIVEDIGLLVIAIATVIAMGFEIVEMIKALKVTLGDLLLLFIYLEVLAMVAMYLESGKLPIRMPLYIAIVAVARYMILDMKNIDNWRMLGLAGTALILAITVLTIRYGHTKFPYDCKEDGDNAKKLNESL